MKNPNRPNKREPEEPEPKVLTGVGASLIIVDDFNDMLYGLDTESVKRVGAPLSYFPAIFTSSDIPEGEALMVDGINRTVTKLVFDKKKEEKVNVNRPNKRKAS